MFNTTFEHGTIPQEKHDAKIHFGPAVSGIRPYRDTRPPEQDLAPATHPARIFLRQMTPKECRGRHDS